MRAVTDVSAKDIKRFIAAAITGLLAAGGTEASRAPTEIASRAKAIGHAMARAIDGGERDDDEPPSSRQ